MSTQNSIISNTTYLQYATPKMIGALPASPNCPPPFKGGPKKDYCSYAPLIDAKIVNEQNTFIRITLMVDSSVTEVSVPSSQPQNNPTQTASGVQITIDYNSIGKATGVINLWYLELEYAGKYNTVTVFLKDEDPELSRGTTTTVQS